jgi:[ribosomal protein S5]-alanine N-acetyltransferase
MPAPVLTDGRVVLRPVRESDRDERRSHGWHAEIERGYGHVVPTGPMTDEQAQEWYADRLARIDEPVWSIEVDGRLAGVAFLHTHVPEDRRARFAIGLLSPALQGRGIGRAATMLVLGHAFTAMALHRVDLRVLEFNTGAIACYRACGFVQEGRERESCLLEGEWYDDILMGVLEHEFRALGTT